MISALIQSEDQTAILKLPSDPFTLQYDLSHIGIRSRLRDIPIKDDEESPIRVKLFADSDIGNSLAVLFKPSHSLEDANLCAYMMENARPELQEESEQNIVHGQYHSPKAVMEDIKAMTDELIGVTIHYYCPLQIHMVDEEYGDWFEVDNSYGIAYSVVEKLAENYPEISFAHEWADEDIGQNCGRYSYQNGERIEEYFPETQKEAIEFACQIWDYDPLDLDLCLNASGTRYICVENEEYQQIELLGKSALFTNDRLTDEDVPQGMYCYHLRHSDDGGRFCSVEPKVGVNHGGSVITKEPIDFGEQGYISFTEDTEPNFTGEEQTLGEFIKSDVEQLPTDRSGSWQIAKGRHRK